MHTPSATINESDSTSYWRLIYFSLILLLPTLVYGFNASTPSIAIAQLNLNAADASLFGSIALYGSPISIILGGIIIDKYGRKTVMICSILPSFVGWLLMYWNYNTFVLLLGQTCLGLTLGSILIPIQVYVGECIFTRNIRLRNAFMVLIGFNISLGVSIGLFLSTLMNYYGICIILMVLTAVLSAIFIIVIPESPPWLRLKGRIGDAEWSEKKLGITQPILNDKYQYKNCKSETVETGNEFHLWTSIRDNIQLLKRPDVCKPFFILCVGAIVIPACGQLTVFTYMINIFDDSVPGQEIIDSVTLNGPLSATETNSGVTAEAYKYGLICSLFTVVGSLVGSILLPFMGMRNIMMSVTVSTILGLGTLTYCSSLESAVDRLEWRIGAISLICFVYGISLGPIFTMAGDLFPIDAKGFSCGSAIIANLSSATANMIFPYLYQIMNSYAYCVYIAINVLSLIYIGFLMPEVVGKTLDEINKEFL